MRYWRDVTVYVYICVRSKWFWIPGHSEVRKGDSHHNDIITRLA